MLIKRKIDSRLDALETCLLTMNELRQYLRKAENYCFPFCCNNKYEEELKYIDDFLEHLFAQEKHYRGLQEALLK
jgi:hypothetical protein